MATRATCSVFKGSSTSLSLMVVSLSGVPTLRHKTQPQRPLISTGHPADPLNDFGVRLAIVGYVPIRLPATASALLMTVCVSTPGARHQRQTGLVYPRHWPPAAPAAPRRRGR